MMRSPAVGALFGLLALARRNGCWVIGLLPLLGTLWTGYRAPEWLEPRRLTVRLLSLIHI